MGKETKEGHTATPSENSNNQTKTGTERSSRGGRHRNATGMKKNSGISNTFNVSVAEVDSVLGT